MIRKCIDCGQTFTCFKARLKCLDCYRKQEGIEDYEDDDYDED